MNQNSDCSFLEAAKLILPHSDFATAVSVASEIHCEENRKSSSAPDTERKEGEATSNTRAAIFCTTEAEIPRRTTFER